MFCQFTIKKKRFFWYFFNIKCKTINVTNTTCHIIVAIWKWNLFFLFFFFFADAETHYLCKTEFKTQIIFWQMWVNYILAIYYLLFSWLASNNCSNRLIANLAESNLSVNDAGQINLLNYLEDLNSTLQGIYFIANSYLD